MSGIQGKGSGIPMTKIGFKPGFASNDLCEKNWEYAMLDSLTYSGETFFCRPSSFNKIYVDPDIFYTLAVPSKKFMWMLFFMETQCLQ